MTVVRKLRRLSSSGSSGRFWRYLFILVSPFVSTYITTWSGFALLHLEVILGACSCHAAITVVSIPPSSKAVNLAWGTWVLASSVTIRYHTSSALFLPSTTLWRRSGRYRWSTLVEKTSSGGLPGARALRRLHSSSFFASSTSTTYNPSSLLIMNSMKQGAREEGEVVSVVETTAADAKAAECPPPVQDHAPLSEYEEGSFSSRTNPTRYHGRLVARILPPGMRPDDVLALQAKNVLSKQALAPSVLKALLSSLPPSNQPARTLQQYDHDEQDHILSPPLTPESTRRQEYAAEYNDDDPNTPQEVVLSLYLWNEEEENVDGDPTDPDQQISSDTHTFMMQMNRDAHESAANMLKRMQLSLTRKLLQQQQQQKHEPFRKRREQASMASMRVPTPTVWYVKAEDIKDDRHYDQGLLSRAKYFHIDEMHSHIDGVTIAALFREAMHKPMAIALHVPAVNISSSTSPSLPDEKAPRDSTPSCYYLGMETGPPTVASIQTFEDFQARVFVSVPLVITVETLFADGVRVDWFVGDRYVKRHSRCYTPQLADIGQTISVLVTPYTEQHSGHGCQHAYRFTHTVEPLPFQAMVDLRSAWLQQSSPRIRTESSKASPNIRVVTYNILADQNAFAHHHQQQQSIVNSNRQSFYPYVPVDVLTRERRMPLILHEILSYQADVICLQEVDTLVYDRLLQPVLSYFGYEGVYTAKVNAGTREGCATFWAKERFTVDPQPYSYALRDLIPSKLGTDHDDEEWRETWQTSADLLHHRPDLQHVLGTALGHVVHVIPLRLLHPDASSPIIWVVNTHLFFHPLASHIRMLQMLCLCRQLSRLFPSGSSTGRGVILCGDLNSSLCNAAGKLAVDRALEMNFRDTQRDLNSFSWSNEDEDLVQEESASEDGIEQPDLTSTTGADHQVRRPYDDFPAWRLPVSFPVLQSVLQSDPPLFTHHIRGFSASIDHILISTETLRPADPSTAAAGAPMPNLQDVPNFMPSAEIPSDHVSLVCDVQVIRSMPTTSEGEDPGGAIP